MGDTISRRTLLGAMASIVPAAHAATPYSLRLNDNAIVFGTGSRELWRADRFDILAALGPDARLELPSENKVRIVNGRLLGAVNCSLELAASASGDLQFALWIGPSSRLDAKAVAARTFTQIEQPFWMATAELDGPTFRVIRKLLRDEQLIPYGPLLVGVDEKLRIHVVDNAGMSYWPMLGRFRHLQLLPVQEGEGISRWPLAIAREPLDQILRFDAGARDGMRLEVSMPTATGEAAILAHGDRHYRSVTWRAGRSARSRGLVIKLKETSGAERGAFPGTVGTRVSWSHSDREDATRGKVLTRLDWCLPAEPFAFQSRHGRFSLCGEQFYDEFVPPGVVSESANGRLVEFRATAYVTNYAVTLPGADFGRLDFDRLRCTFPLAGLGETSDDSYVQLSANWGKSKDAISLSLDVARLRVMRARDHLSLTYRFHNVSLRRAAGPVRFVPSPDAALIAELPPQHVAERAFARQLPVLPGPRGDLTPDQLRLLQSRKFRDREQLQEDIKKQAITNEFGAFAKRFGEAIKAGKIELAAPASAPGLQRQSIELKLPKGAAEQLDAVWVGPQYVRTVWARRAARELAMVIAAEPGAQGLPTMDAFPTLYGHSVAAWDILQRTVRKYPKVAKPQNPEDTKKFADEAVAQILEAASRSSDEQRILQDVYRRRRKQPGQNNGSLPEYFLTKEALTELEKWLRQEIEKWLDPEEKPPPWLAYLAQAAIISDEKVKAEITAEYWKEQLKQGTDVLPVDLPVYARLSGISRLVFQWPDKAIAYTTDDLCDWEKFTLQVAKRARAFLPKPETIEKTAAAIDEQKRIDEEQKRIGDALEERGIRRGGSTAQRLIDIVKATEAGPANLETAIELPYRLILSPAETAKFVTGSGAAPPATDPNPLWHARLKERDTSTLRALWSRDYWARSAFPQESVRPTEPPRGPWAPWQLEPGGEPRDRFRGSLDAFDRHQLVGLTSVFGMPVIPRRGPDQRTLHTTQLAPPPGFELTHNILDEPEPRDGLLPISDKDDQALYHPQTLTGPLAGDQGQRALPFLALSAAGGFLTVDTSFTPPASLRWKSGNNLFNAFSLGRWQHQIVQGGDVTAQVEYVGFLMPTGHQATLVKLSERVNLLPTSGLVPTSYLVQRHFIRVSPEKNYNVAEAPGMPFACRGWPATKITMRGSLRTPDLVDPTQDRPIRGDASYAGSVSLGGRIDLRNATGLAFWPRTGRSPDKNVQFTFSIDDSKDVVSMPMIFVDNQAAHDPMTMIALYNYYNGIRANAAASGKAPAAGGMLRETPVADKALRTIKHFGALRRYAVPRTPGDTTLETTEWLVRVDGRRGDADGEGVFAPDNQPSVADFRMNSTLESRDQPPFYPRLELATVRPQTVSGLSQTPQPDSQFRYFPKYLESGFTAETADDARESLPGDTFFQTVGKRPELDMAGNGDRAGGVGRPSQKIVGLARVGPVGNSKPKEQEQKVGTVESFGASFFDDKAKLLGLVSLNELIAKAKALVEHDPDVKKLLAAPLLREQLLYQAGDAVISALKAFDSTAVKPLLRKLDKVQMVYGAAYGAVKRLDDTIGRALQLDQDLKAAGANKAELQDKLVNQISEVMAATVQAKAEIDAVMAAPLTQLVEAARKIATQGPLDLQAALERFAWPIEIVPAPLTRLLAGLDVELLLRLVPEGAMRDRLAAIRPQLEGAFAKALKNVLTAPLPPDIGTLQQSVETAFKTELERRNAELEKALQTNAAETMRALKDAIDSAIEAGPPSALKDTYHLIHDVLTKGDPAQLKKLKEIVDASKNATMAVCLAAAKEMDGVRRQLLPLEITSDGCLVCGPQIPDDSTNFCRAAHLALAELKSLRLKEVDDFHATTCELALRFESLAFRVRLLGRQPEVLCSSGGIYLWGLAEAAREKFSSRLIEWVTSARELVTKVEGSQWSNEAKRRLGRYLSEALAKAIDVIVPPESNIDSSGPQPIERYRRLRVACDSLKDEPSIATFMSQTTSLKEQLDTFKDEAHKLIKAQVDKILVPHKKDVAAVGPLLAAVLPLWYDAVAKLRDGLVEQVPVLRQKLGRGVIWDVEKDLYLDSDREQDKKAFQAERAALTAMQGPDEDKRFDALQAFVEAIKEKGPAPVRLVNQISRRFGDRLRETAAAKIMELVDLREDQERLQKQLTEMLPTQRLLNYQFALPLKDIDIGGLIVFRPDTSATKVAALSMESKTTVDIKNGRVTSLFGGKTNEFFIDIGRGGEFLSLKFGAFEFGGGTGSSTSFKAPLRNVTIGPKMAFLAALSAFMGAKDGGGKGGAGKPPTGPYIDRRALGPGIVAGYRLGFPVFTIGAMGFANVFFDAHCELPFNADDSVVRLSLSSRQSPMTIFYGVYGGSAYFQIEGDRRGTRRVDISLEFGGAQAIDYGPLKGVGRVMTGIMVSRSGGSGTLSALFTADFTGHIACFGIAACFSLSMTQGEGGVSGVATLTYSFSYGLAKVSFRVTVFKREKNVSGDKQAFLDHPFRGHPIMLAQSGGTSITDAGGPTSSMVTFAVSPRHDWGASRAIYSTFANAVGRRKRA